jgi:ABC-type dipeptide/oligopeptide/nickel transport system ATPase component
MLATLGLLGAASVEGSASFRGTELIGLPPSRLRAIRGGKVSMIFQDPMTSLNPVLTVGRQLSLVMRAHQPQLSKTERARRVIQLLDRVSIAQATRRADAYPHEMSGGMRQRVMIAMAIANDPEVLIADEPTTALDVTVQAQIMDLLDELRRENNLALVLITHDLGVVAGATDRVAVMYAGRVVETSDVRPLFSEPSHPYTPRVARLPPTAGRPARGPRSDPRSSGVAARPSSGLSVRAALHRGARLLQRLGARPRAVR